MATISGLSVVRDDAAGGEAKKVRFVGYGTYTAGDFTITARPMYAPYGTTVWDPNIDPAITTNAVQLSYGGLPWAPTYVRVMNLTDGTGSEWWLNSNLPYPGFTQAAAGDKTPVAASSAGVSWANGVLTIDVSACAGSTGITNNDEFIIECER
jgi:hypothetical protein